MILAVTLYWLQSRQAKKADIEAPKKPEKEISVVKARDWPVVEEKKENPEPEPVEEPESPGEEETPAPVEVDEPEIVETPVEPEETVDISQLSGIGPKYRSLLKEAGITTINQVAGYEPEELLSLLLETNERTEVTKRPPTKANVESWIESAKTQLG